MRKIPENVKKKALAMWLQSCAYREIARKNSETDMLNSAGCDGLATFFDFDAFQLASPCMTQTAFLIFFSISAFRLSFASLEASKKQAGALPSAGGTCKQFCPREGYYIKKASHKPYD